MKFQFQIQLGRILIGKINWKINWSQFLAPPQLFAPPTHSLDGLKSLLAPGDINCGAEITQIRWKTYYCMNCATQCTNRVWRQPLRLLAFLGPAGNRTQSAICAFLRLFSFVKNNCFQALNCAWKSLTCLLPPTVGSSESIAAWQGAQLSFPQYRKMNIKFNRNKVIRFRAICTQVSSFFYFFTRPRKKRDTRDDLGLPLI